MANKYTTKATMGEGKLEPIKAIRKAAESFKGLVKDFEVRTAQKKQANESAKAALTSKGKK